MLQQEIFVGSLNAGINNEVQTILPLKSKTVRSYTTNNQSLEQIMKKANEIIKRTKNCSLINGRPDISDILHPLTESFVTQTTADSLQKNSQSTNREGSKISPFVTTSPPENTNSQQSNLHSSDKSNKAQTKLSIGSQEDSSNQSQKLNITKQFLNNYISEVDYVFENFDSVFRITFTKENRNNGDIHTNNFSQKQNGISSHQSHSLNTRDTDDSCRISLTSVFEFVRREEKCQQQNKYQDQNQKGAIQQQQTTNMVHIRASSSQPNTNDHSHYLIPKQIQQTTSSFQLKMQNQQQIEKQQQSLLQSTGQLQIMIQQSSQSKENLNSSQQFQNLQQISSLFAPSSKQVSCTQQLSQQQNQITQSEIEQYLKKPEPTKVKVQSNPPLHPHPPLPQSTKLSLNQYNTNHFNSQRFRYRNSIRDKENAPEAANTSIGQLNTSNGQIISSLNKSTNNGSYLNNLSNCHISQNYQPTQFQQPQQLQLQQNSSNYHQRSSSNMNTYNQNLLNNSQNQNNNSNSLQNSFGFYRPRFDSTSGPSSNVGERLNTIGNDYNIKNYATTKDRGNNNMNDLSLNYSSMIVNTSYNGSSSNIQSTAVHNGNQNSSRSGSFQVNIPMNKMVARKQTASNSLLNSLLGGQKVQQPQPTLNSTLQNSNNGNINKIVNNAINNSNSNLGNRSTSVPRANVSYLLQKKLIQ